jgi:hypothetical protein
LLQTQDGRCIFEKRERSQAGHHLEEHGGHAKGVGNFEEARNGIFLQVTDSVLVVGKAVEYVPERVQLERGEALPSELVGLERRTCT